MPLDAIGAFGEAGSGAGISYGNGILQEDNQEMIDHPNMTLFQIGVTVTYSVFEPDRQGRMLYHLDPIWAECENAGR